MTNLSRHPSDPWADHGPGHLPEHLLAATAALLPTTALDGARLARGQFHDVVLLPGVAAVRVARDARSAAELPRRTTLLHRLAGRLPFALPRPLTEVLAVDGPAGPTTAVAHSWLPGRAHPPRSGEPRALAGLLAALAAVPTDDLADLLDVPHGDVGGSRWHEVVLREAVPRLPAAWRAAAQRRLDAVLRLDRSPAGWRPALVHGDLAGDNARWDGERLVGVLDWDSACAWDPAVDVACLADWHGWAAVAAVTDAEVLRRARVRQAAFRLEQLASAAHHGGPEELLDPLVRRAAGELERSGTGPATGAG